MAKLSLRVNGKTRVVDAEPEFCPCSYALRNDLELNGPMFGCGLAQCGACTVIMDGVAIRSARHAGWHGAKQGGHRRFGQYRENAQLRDLR